MKETVTECVKENTNRVCSVNLIRKKSIEER